MRGDESPPLTSLFGFTGSPKRGGVLVVVVVVGGPRGGSSGGPLFTDELPETRTLRPGIRRDRRALAPVTAELVTLGEIYVWNSREGWVAAFRKSVVILIPCRIGTSGARDARLRGLCICYNRIHPSADEKTMLTVLKSFEKRVSIASQKS